jgi:hypothetical protein
MIKEKYLDEVFKKANSPLLKDPDVVHDEDVKRNDVLKVLEAVELLKKGKEKR